MIARPLLRILIPIVLALAGCAREPPPGPALDAAAPDLQGLAERWLAGPGRTLALDATASRVDVRVYRAGRLARLGHNHVLEVDGLDGQLREQADGAAVAELRVPVARLQVDRAAARDRAGADFTGTPDAKAVAATRDNLLGPQVLDAARWPTIRIVARVPRLAAGRTQADLVLTVRDTIRRLRAPVQIAVAGDRVEVAGTLLLRQSAFGITPFSVLGGALQVRDELAVDFVIVGSNSAGAL